MLRRAAHEAPEEGAEAALRLLKLEEGPGIADRGAHLLTIADDSRILQELRDLPAVVADHALRVEAVERLEEACTLVEDHAPRESRLEAVQHELGEQLAIVVERHSPFLVVVGEHQRVVAAGPTASDHGPRILHGPGPPG